MYRLAFAGPSSILTLGSRPGFFVRQSRPEYLYFSPTWLSLVGIAGAIAVGAISGFAVVKAWPESGIFPQRPEPMAVATVEPERFYPVPEPAPAVTHPTSPSEIEASIPAPAPIIVDQGAPGVRRLHPVARAASNSRHRQTRTASYRRNGYYTTSPGAWW
jgi:hypothetical protein